MAGSVLQELPASYLVTVNLIIVASIIYLALQSKYPI